MALVLNYRMVKVSYLRDKDGNLVLDKDGNPILVGQ